MKHIISLSLLSLALNAGCGKKEDEATTQAESISSDSELSEASMGANLQDAMDAMSDSNASNGSAALALREPLLDLTRECAVDGDSAVVKLSGEIDFEKSVGVVTFEVKSSFSLERKWSKDGEAIACDDDGKFAKIKLLEDMTGLQADVTFKRESSSSHTVTNKKGTKKSSVEFDAEGSRTITWDSQSTAEDTSITRQITIKSDVSRNLTITEKNGDEAKVDLKLATDADAPLVVETKQTSALVADIEARTIKSGKLIATTAGRGKVESVFDNLKLSFDDEGCNPESGKATISVFAEGSATAAIIYEIKAEAGAYLVTNVTDPANPVEVEDFVIPNCDLRNFDY